MGKGKELSACTKILAFRPCEVKDKYMQINFDC